MVVAASTAALMSMASLSVGTAAQAEPDGGVQVLANGVTVDRQGRVDYNVDLSELPGASISTEKGVQTQAGSCKFNTGQRGKAGNAKVLVVTELSFDPTTCSRQVARAEYPRNQLPASVRAKLTTQQDTSEKRSAADEAPLPVAPTAPKAALAAAWSGSLKVNVEDPPQIDVTTTHSFLDWSTDGVYLYSDHRAEWGWFTGSGWGRESGRFSYDNNGSWAYTDVAGHFRNGVFCLTIDTHTYHNKTYFEGWYDGYWYWEYEVDKSGGCTDLLHYEYIADTP